MVADYYIEKEKLFILRENQKIMLAVERLGLNSISHFKPQEKIIEYVIPVYLFVYPYIVLQV